MIKSVVYYVKTIKYHFFYSEPSSSEEPCASESYSSGTSLSLSGAKSSSAKKKGGISTIKY